MRGPSRIAGSLADAAPLRVREETPPAGAARPCFCVPHTRAAPPVAAWGRAGRQTATMGRGAEGASAAAAGVAGHDLTHTVAKHLDKHLACGSPCMIAPFIQVLETL